MGKWFTETGEAWQITLLQQGLLSGAVHRLIPRPSCSDGAYLRPAVPFAFQGLGDDFCKHILFIEPGRALQPAPVRNLGEAALWTISMATTGLMLFGMCFSFRISGIWRDSKVWTLRHFDLPPAGIHTPRHLGKYFPSSAPATTILSSSCLSLAVDLYFNGADGYHHKVSPARTLR